ncbi:wts-1 [Pristionchus pacificus]|uniref:non-specific serine/threonine protein kinase n=1 Tax=Pristionchus pacificus TaxID=54126 RepID=A0A2A6BMZ8_PRIPA|nr:wts-1 [Pristionchus pacificus]|eukprot:PDM67218.1 wts-1 [Pristionchus pacificus]
MHPPSEHRQARVRPGHHTDKLEQIRDQLNQSRRLIAPPIDPSPPVETQVDITRNLETLLACGADRGRAIEALSKTSSVAQAAQWLFDNNRSARPTQQEDYDEPRSSEMPIPSMTHNDGYYMNAGTDSYYNYAKSRVAPAPPVTPSPSLSSMRPDYYEPYYQQRLMEENYNSRMSSPSSTAPVQHHSIISTNYSLPMTTSHSSSHSSTVFRSPSPSIASSSSSRIGLSPSKAHAEYNRTHLKMTLSANSPYATDPYVLSSSPQISKVSISKMNERESPIYRPSPINDHREEREGVPVMKARLPTLPSNLSINVKSGGGPVNANISSEDHRYYNYPMGVPSTSSSSVYLNSTSSMDSVNTKVIYHDEIRRPDMRPPPSEYIPTTNSYRAPSPNLPTYSQAARKPMQSVPIGGSQPLVTTSVFIGRTAFPTATQIQTPGPSTRSAAPPPPSLSTKRRSLSPLPEDVKNRIKNNSHTRTIESCKPRLFRFFMEQHIERLLEQQKDRTKRADQLRKEMDEAKLAESAKNLLLDHLLQKESRYMRLKRQKMNKDMFEHIKHIGVGAFGRVSLVKKRDTGLVYAMKSLLKKDVISKNQAAHVKAERDILAEADSPWIVRLFFSFQDERCLYFIMEYVPGGDMMELLIKKGWFNEMEARFYISELTVAIDYVHSLGFIHRDIKPDNILIDREGHLKLTDFGLCTGLRWTHDKKYYGLENDDRPGHLREDSLTINAEVNGSADSGKVKILEARHRKKRDQAHSLVGTTSYMAPEVILRTGHTQLCDWWSVGVILYEMVYGRAPFSSEYDDEEIKSKIVNHRYELKLYKRVPVADGYNTLSDECIMIIRDLCSEQNSRLGKDEGAADVQGHPWFKDVNFDTLRQQTAVWKPQIAHSEDTSNFEPLELAEFPFDSLRAPPPNNPAFYEFTFRHFFDSGGQGSLNRGPQSHRPPFARGAIPFDGVSSSQLQYSQQTQQQQHQSGRSSQPPPYASATSGQSMQHIREASTESIEI